MDDVLSGLIGNVIHKGGSNTGNIAVDVQLNHLWHIAEQKQISLCTKLEIPSKVKIADEDICVLLGNAIDNALEALINVKEGEKRLWIIVKYEKGSLLIVVKNKYVGDLKYSEKGRLISDKKGKGHGYGIYSMDRIAKKY